MSKAMKVSLQMSKKGSTTHNSRNFNLERAKHIDPTRTHLNHYVAIYPELKHDFTAVEKKFYKEQFKDWVDDIKKEALAQRHPERAKTSEKLRSMDRYKPDEIIYQIGDIDNAPTSKDFRKWMQKMMAYHNKITKGHCPILNAAIHNDEFSPHAHVRQVWIYKDKNKEGKSIIKVNKVKALEAAGIPLPDKTKPEGLYNNRLMTYTKMMRDEGERLAIEMGYNIDTHHTKRKHLSKEDYIKFAREQEARKQFQLHEKREEENRNKKMEK